jgi:DNA-binding MarR family transcriptional regulator
MDSQAQAIAELFESISRAAYSRGFSAGLNPAQWAALRFFAGANPSACTVTGFARAHRAGTGTAAQTVSALVRKGFLSREAVPGDRRRVRFAPSASGRQLLDEADPLRATIEAIGALPEAQLRALVDALATLSRMLLDREPEP